MNLASILHRMVVTDTHNIPLSLLNFSRTHKHTSVYLDDWTCMWLGLSSWRIFGPLHYFFVLFWFCIYSFLFKTEEGGEITVHLICNLKAKYIIPCPHYVVEKLFFINMKIYYTCCCFLYLLISLPRDLKCLLGGCSIITDAPGFSLKIEQPPNTETPNSLGQKKKEKSQFS